MVCRTRARCWSTVPSGPRPTTRTPPAVPASLRPAPFPRSHHYGALGGAYHSEPDSSTSAASGTAGVHYRESAVDVPQGVLVVAESLNSTTDTLSSLATRPAPGVAGRVGGPVRRRPVSPCAEVCGRSRPWPRRPTPSPPGTSPDGCRSTRASSEVARLGRALNAMLARIEAGVREKSTSERRLRQFVADASHELRTPLTSIRGYTELLRKGAFTDDEGKDRALQRVEREAARMGALGRRPAPLGPPGPGAAPRPCPGGPAPGGGRRRRRRPGGRPRRPRQPLSARPGVVLGDRDRLGQVAHNLVRNALDHTPPGTPVDRAGPGRCHPAT